MRNLRHAVRILARTWLFSLAAIAILALCIGVNTAVLAVVDAVLIRPLPYPSPEGLLQIVAVARHEGAEAVQQAQPGEVERQQAAAQGFLRRTRQGAFVRR